MARGPDLTVVPLVRLSLELYDNCNLDRLILGADGNVRGLAFLGAGNWFRRMLRGPSKGGEFIFDTSRIFSVIEAYS